MTQDQLIKKRLSEAIKGTFEDNMKATSCTVLLGYVKTPDGREAQIHISVTADDDDWIIRKGKKDTIKLP